MAFENLFIRTKRTIGSVQLDSVLLEEHEGFVSITKNPVESGADITDHAIVQPDILSIKGLVTDSPLGLAALGQIIDSITNLFGTSTSSNLTRSQQAYRALEVLKNNAEPIDVTTRLKTYSNMMITSLSTSQDKDTSQIVILDITLEEIIITESSTTDIGESDLFPSVNKTGSTTVDRGRQEVKKLSDSTSSSILNTIGDWLGG